MGRSKKRPKRHRDDSSTSDDDSTSSEDEPVKRGRRKEVTRRSRGTRQRYPSSDESTSGESHTSSESSSSGERPGRKRRRLERHPRRHKRHWSAKRERRATRKGPESDDDELQVLSQAAPKRVVAVAKQPCEKLPVNGPPFLYPPSADRRVPLEEFTAQHTAPARTEKERQLERRPVEASASQPVLMVPTPLITAAPDVRRSRSNGEGGIACGTTSTLRTIHPAAKKTCAQAPKIPKQKERSAPREYKAIEEYLCKAFGERPENLWTVFRYKMDRVKQLLVGKHVRGIDPGLNLGFIVHGIPKETPSEMGAGEASTVAEQLRQRGIELKHPSTWPCLVHKRGKEMLYYPLEVLKIEEREEEEEEEEEGELQTRDAGA